MPKKRPNLEAEPFGKRLVELLAKQFPGRRGAGAYLSRRYRVSNVTANGWLNGTYRPETELARRIAEDHGSTFDQLYFGKQDPAGVKETAMPYNEAQDLSRDLRHLALALTAMCDWIRETRPIEAPLLVENLEKLARLDGSLSAHSPIGVMLLALKGPPELSRTDKVHEPSQRTAPPNRRP